MLTCNQKSNLTFIISIVNDTKKPRSSFTLGYLVRGLGLGRHLGQLVGVLSDWAWSHFNRLGQRQVSRPQDGPLQEPLAEDEVQAGVDDHGNGDGGDDDADDDANDDVDNNDVDAWAAAAELQLEHHVGRPQQRPRRQRRPRRWRLVSLMCHHLS